MTGKRPQRPTYEEALTALERYLPDYLCELRLDVEETSKYPQLRMIADLFGRMPEAVAVAILNRREVKRKLDVLDEEKRRHRSRMTARDGRIQRGSPEHRKFQKLWD